MLSANLPFRGVALDPACCEGCQGGRTWLGGDIYGSDFRGAEGSFWLVSGSREEMAGDEGGW